MRTFLLQTSILDRLCGPLCEAVVDADPAGPVDGQAMLEALEEMNLFIIPLDDERRWYRYHHLFADVLRKRLEHQFPHLLPELHRRASHWYEQNGFIAESIQHAIAAGDQERAAQLIEENGCLLLMSGEVATLLNWIDAIEFQSENPSLAGHSKSLGAGPDRGPGAGRADPASSRKTARPTRTHRRGQDTAGNHCRGPGALCQRAREYAFGCGICTGRRLELLPDCSSISQSIRSVATSILGDASWINGNLEEAIQAYTEAIQIGREANNLNMVIIANSNIADILMEQGQLHRAADTYTQTLQMAVRPDGQRSPLAGKIFAGLGRLSYEWNRLEDAEQAIRQCMELSRIWGDIGQQAYAYAIQARLEQARNNPEKTQEAMREAERLIGEHPLSPHWSIQVRADLARVWLAQGNLERPSQRIQKRGLTDQRRNPLSARE